MSRQRPTAGTPAILELQGAGVVFTVHEFDHDPAERNYGMAAAVALAVEPDRVFKTLLAEMESPGGAGARPETVVAIVPVTTQLSLRDLASAAGGKRAEMCRPEHAERITGYVVGGISPFGQERRLRTVIDETCVLFETIFVSGGRRGLDLEISPDDLVQLLDATVASIGA